MSQLPDGPFVAYPHPALATKALPRPVDNALRDVGQLLLQAAQQVRAYGLAAAHLGVIEPVIVLNVSPDGEANYEPFYNPDVIAVAPELAAGREASVSLPGVEVEIVRPVWAEIGFDTPDGIRQRRRFEGFLARCALHEIEQLNGRFFLANLSRLKREMVLKKASRRQSG